MSDWGKAEWGSAAALAAVVLFILFVFIGQHDARTRCEAIGGVPIDAGYHGTSVVCLNPEAIRK